MRAGVDRGGDAPALLTTVVVSGAALLVVGQLYATIPLGGQIAADLGGGPGGVSWVSTAFGLAYAVGMLVGGPLSDVHGRRVVMVSAVGLTAVLTLVVAVAPSLPLLILARAAQGAAAAGLAPAALAYLGERVRPSRLGLALSVTISSFVAAAILAPLGAVALSGARSWRAWFWATSPILALVAIALAVVLRPSSARAAGVTRRPGAVVGELGSVLRTPRLWGLYLLTATVMVAFVGSTAAVGALRVGQIDAQAMRLWTMPACVIAPALVPLVSRIPVVRRLLVVGCSLAAAVAATGTVSSLPATAALLGLVTGLVVLSGPALVEVIGDLGQSRRGAALSWYGCTLFLGASIAGQVVPLLTARGALLTWTVLAGSVAAGTAAAGAGLRRSMPPQ